MKKRILSFVLCLVMVFSLLPTFALPAAAADENGTITNPAPATDESGALTLTKTLTPGENGTYDITMESYATAEVSHQDYTEKVPTDFVIIVDQSGSMATTDMPVSSDSYTGPKTVDLKTAAEGKYYVKDGDQYYRVYGQRGYLYARYNANTYNTYDLVPDMFSVFSDNDSDNGKTADSRDWFYYRDDQTGQYYKARIRVIGRLGYYECQFYKLDENGNEIARYGPSHWTPAHGTRQYYNLQKVGSTILSAEEIREVMYLRKMSYDALYYRDVNGKIHYLDSNQGKQTAEFCNQNGDAIATDADTNSNHGGGNKLTYSGLYELTGATETRLSSLETALNAFVGAVANEKDDNGSVDNRIAIVGFSSASGYDNTELLTGVNIDTSNSTSNYFTEGYTSFPYYGANYTPATSRGTNYNGAQYGTTAISNGYANALLSATDGDTVGAVNPALTQAIKSVTASGGTQPEYGFEMAEQIFKTRTDTTYDLKLGDNAGQTVQRNKVVIFFTDGEPGDDYHSNRYAEANQVVEEALDLKHYVDPKTNTVIPATVFTIGVFSDSDSMPLTYQAGSGSASDSATKYEYENHWSWVKTEKSGSTNYYLFRQWIANQPTGYGTVANDTIYDYMSVVSSNYPDAEGFITQAWLNGNHEGTYLHATNDYRHIDKAESTNKYYRMASNQDTLVKAFLEAVTLAGTTSSESHSVDVDETAHLVDTINTDAFAIDGATYSVYKYPIKYDNGSVVPDSSREIVEVEENVSVPTNGTVDVTGFDYSGDRVSELKPEGWKLVVKITGIVPTFSTGAQPSNDGKAAIMADGAEKPVVDIDSPTLNLSNVAAKTYVIDFNAKMKVAEEATQLVGAVDNVLSGTNGKFVKSGTNVTYQLDSGNQANKTAVINEAYTGVDTALVFGNAYDLSTKAFATEAGWNQITTVPASSVYYDDDFTTENAPTVTVGDGHGKTDIASTGTIDASGKYYFTFYGTGIDVYCTTHGDGGYVSAAVFSGSGESACTSSNRVGSAKTIRNYSDENYYNTPSLSFTGLTAGTYTLKINAPTNAQFRLDGVRVYNPVKAEDAEHNQTDASKTLERTDEANANYLNLREFLLNAQGGFSVVNEIPQDGTIDPAAVSGVLFINDVGSVVTESHWYKDEGAEEDTWHENAAPIYQSQFDVYKANGPKNEIYLDGQQGITFQLSNKVPVGKKVWIGLSAPADGSGSVSITGKDGSVSVNSVMDMYYDFTVPANRQITITNLADKGSGDIIAVTNLKITGIADLIPAVTQNNQEEVFHAARAVFAPVTMKTIRMAANNGVDPEEVVEEPETPVVPENPDTPDTPDQPDDPKPGWDDSFNGMKDILKALFENLLKNLFDLFKGLGNW